MAVLFSVLLLHAFIFVIEAEIAANASSVILALVRLVLVEAEGTALCPIVIEHVKVDTILAFGCKLLCHGVLLTRYATQ